MVRDTIVGLAAKTEQRILKILNLGRFDVNESATHITYSSEHTDHDMYCYFGTQYEYLDLEIQYTKKHGMRVFVTYEVTYETDRSARYDYHIDNIETYDSDLIHSVAEIISYRRQRKYGADLFYRAEHFA